jgi:hypothetical protein
MSEFENVESYLKALGVNDEMDTFVGRKKVQKLVYLLKQFGADLPFGYNWYLHGPYSPKLTRNLLESEAVQNREPPKLPSYELERVNELRNFLAEDFYSVDSLELYASLIYLIKHAQEAKLSSKMSIIRFLLEKKPQFTRDEIEKAWDRIESSGRWDNYMRF